MYILRLGLTNRKKKQNKQTNKKTTKKQTTTTITMTITTTHFLCFSISKNAQQQHKHAQELV